MEDGKELEVSMMDMIMIYNDEVLRFKCVTCRCYVYSHLCDLCDCLFTGYVHVYVVLL